MTMVSPGLERYAVECRTMLDLVAFELQRIGLLAGDTVAVVSPSPLLVSDLADRLAGHLTLCTDPCSSSTCVYLLGSREALRQLGVHPCANVIFAFKNSLSHKSLLYPTYKGLNPGLVEARIRAHFRLTAAWGIMPPARVALLALAALARNVGRYDVGHHLSDRALLSPLVSGIARYVSPIGVAVGRSV